MQEALNDGVVDGGDALEWLQEGLLTASFEQTRIAMAMIYLALAKAKLAQGDVCQSMVYFAACEAIQQAT